MPAIKTFDSDVKIWFPMAHWILSKKSFLPRLFVNEPQVYAISFPSLVYQRLWRICAWILISRNIFWGMPDFPNIFGVNNRCRTQAYVWRHMGQYQLLSVLSDRLSPLNIDHSRNLPVEICGINYTEKYTNL